jgi:hypothetical protein
LRTKSLLWRPRHGGHLRVGTRNAHPTTCYRKDILSRAYKRMFSGLVMICLLIMISLSTALSVVTEVNAACGGLYQRMQVGILPDVFLNHTVDTADQVFPVQLTPPRNQLETITYPFRWIWRQFEIIFQFPVTIREKTFKHTWTGNLDLP